MNDADIEGLLDRMSLEEQVSLLSGADFWTTAAVPRLGVPAIKVTDGPNGARGGGSLVGSVKAASFPAGVALGSTWSPAIVEEIGAAIAEEARTKGARVLLAPTVNIQRSTTNGRNFECYSEDPHLTAELSSAYIRGVQGKGVAATIKHFVGNESEIDRTTASSEVSERALREVYLPPFEAAVKRAGVRAVMSAYNRVNGVFASEHQRLLTDVLKREWGFDGVVMSDWFGSHTTAETVLAGLDLEMPGPTRDRGDKLVAAVREGKVPAEAVRESARRVLRLVARVGAFESPAIEEERAIDEPEHRALCRRAAIEGMVLLKNEGLLPLDASVGTFAVIGPNAREARIMGGGSAQLSPHYSVSPWEGLVAARGGEGGLAFAEGCKNHRLTPLLRGPVAIEYFASSDLSGPSVHTGASDQTEVMWIGPIGPGVDPRRFSARLTATFTPEVSGEHVFGLVSAGLSRLFVDGELVIDAWAGWKRGANYFGDANDEAFGRVTLEAGRPSTVVVEYAAPTANALGMKVARFGVAAPLDDAALEEAVRIAQASTAALVFVGRSGEWDSEGADLPDMNLPGRQDELVARVAAANPRTVVVLQSGGPVAMPWLDQVAAVIEAWYPGQECGNAIVDVLFGKASPGGRLPQTFPARIEDNPTHTGDPATYPGVDGRVHYREGVLVGYRHYDARGVEPLFPFGHGLTYATFAWGPPRVDAASLASGGGSVTVSLDVTNTGQRAGSEVVQLYVRDETARLDRPDKELRAFAKVDLSPGETRTVTLALEMRSFAFFDEALRAWVAEAGRFELLLGASSRDIRAKAELILPSDWTHAVG